MHAVWQIPQLQHLERVARIFKVSMCLRGGVAFRYVLERHRKGAQAENLDLFDLAAFTSDVDLSHSGEPDITNALLDAILDRVQFAECFRWELRPERPISVIEEVSSSNFVPARLLEIRQSSDEGIVDPADGLRDIRENKYRYIRNPLFKYSRRYRAGRDIEAFSALLYLQTLGEANVSDHSNQPGWASIQQVFGDADDDEEQLQLLQQHAYLRARLRHLLHSMVSTYPDRGALSQISERSGLSSWLSRMDSQGGTVPLVQGVGGSLILSGSFSDEFFVTSERVGGDTYRLDPPRSPWALSPPQDLPFPELGEQEEVLVFSPYLSVNSRTQDLRRYTSYGEPETISTGVAQQFVYISLANHAMLAPVIAQLALSEKNLSSIMMIKDATGKWTPWSFPTVASIDWSGTGSVLRVKLRINCFGILSESSVVAAYIAITHYREPFL